MGTKKELKKASVSSRFINKDFKNLSSAQIIGEKLIKSESDYNYIKTSPLTPLQFGEGKASRCEQG
ncbi:MAG: hypothetical protein LBF15_03770 [Candidatus Peribacteria bacterium]|jgi:hypothetical protein|nr:hypothetical protein [Candidatus Peribacteria bacterium]